MKKYFRLLFSSTMMILATGCETFRSGSSSSQYAGLSRDIIELQNRMSVLNGKIANLQNSNARITRNISALQNQINYVNEQNQQQNKTINVLNQALEQERAKRRAAMDKVIETVADQTAKTVNTIARQRQPKPGPKSVPAMAGAYYKHKVESGETLSAIARAYKVSVSEIKQANNLKGHIIRVGQILHIPKK